MATRRPCMRRCTPATPARWRSVSPPPQLRPQGTGRASNDSPPLTHTLARALRGGGGQMAKGCTNVGKARLRMLRRCDYAARVCPRRQQDDDSAVLTMPHDRGAKLKLLRPSGSGRYDPPTLPRPRYVSSEARALRTGARPSVHRVRRGLLLCHLATASRAALDVRGIEAKCAQVDSGVGGGEGGGGRRGRIRAKRGKREKRATKKATNRAKRAKRAREGRGR